MRILTTYFIIIFLGASIYCQDTKQCLKIDFESLGSTTLYEGLPINKQFFDVYGVTFELENGNIPVLAQVGGSVAFAFSSANGFDTPAPDQNVGRFFITDDGTTNSLVATPLIVRFEDPVDSVAAQVLDMDFDEIFTVTARDKNDKVLLTKTIKAGDAGTGDGIATVFGFNMPGCAGTIYSLKFQGTRTVSGGFGFAMDNFSFCFSGIDLENSIDYDVEVPTCISPKGSIRLINRGSYDVLYSLDKVLYTKFDAIPDLIAGTYQIFIKSSDEGCDAQITVEIPEPIYPKIIDSVLAQTTCGQTNGSIRVLAVGDSLRYSIDKRNFSINNSFTGLPPGNYQVNIINKLGCKDSIEVVINASTPVVFSSIATTLDKCKGATGTIKIDMATVGNYSYFINDKEIQKPEAALLTAGSYKVTVRDNLGCKLDSTVVIEATPTLIFANISAIPTKCNEQNGEISFSINAGESQLSYFLNDREILDTAVVNLDWGQYSLLIKDEYDCELRTTIDVERDKCPVYLPNIINGNPSSVNNRFVIKTLDDYNLNILKYRIYDRWGNLVYSAGVFNVHTDDAYWWRGSFNGLDAETGVYTYIIDVLHPNGDVEYMSGDVSLIR